MENYLKEKVREIEDYPVKGVLFRDLTPLFKDNKCLRKTKEAIVGLYKGKGVTKVVCVESRGFIMGSLIADGLNAGVVLARKAGKLPCKTVGIEYEKEYGKDRLEMHADSISENDVVLIHDDLLATGGTLKAVLDLVLKFNPKAVYVNVIAELKGLKGRSAIGNDVQVTSLIKYA